MTIKKENTKKAKRVTQRENLREMFSKIACLEDLQAFLYENRVDIILSTAPTSEFYVLNFNQDRIPVVEVEEIQSKSSYSSKITVSFEVNLPSSNARYRKLYLKGVHEILSGFRLRGGDNRLIINKGQCPSWDAYRIIACEPPF